MTGVTSVAAGEPLVGGGGGRGGGGTGVAGGRGHGACARRAFAGSFDAISRISKSVSDDGRRYLREEAPGDEYEAHESFVDLHLVIY